ncbi:putative metal-dependent RNase [Bradyrhizobium diazoefficiens]
MSGDWNTKYGTRRVRHDPPTLEEAIFAAIGITDDVEAQAEIASALMGLPYDDVLAEVKKTARVSARTGTATRVIAGEQGAQRSVVVERPRGSPLCDRQAHRHLRNTIQLLKEEGQSIEWIALLGLT